MSPARPAGFRWRARLVLAALCAGMAGDAFADDTAPSSDSLREALGAWQAGLQQVSSIASDFVQEKHLALFQDALIIQGRLFITSDGRFAWETHWPVRYKLVVANERILQWDEETGRVMTISMRDNPVASTIHAQMSAWFSGQYETLTNTYDAALSSTNPVSFLFKPREGTPAASYLSAVQVWLRPDGRYLDRMQITERSGDSTSIAFTNTVLNQALPSEIWNVKVLSASTPVNE